MLQDIAVKTMAYQALGAKQDDYADSLKKHQNAKNACVLKGKGNAYKKYRYWR